MTIRRTQAALDRLTRSIEEDAMKTEKLESLLTHIQEITGTTRVDQAVSVIESTRRDLEASRAEIQELCEAAGVAHKGCLLQKLRAMKSNQNLLLPDWCEFYPPHWVREVKVERTEVSYNTWRIVTTPSVTPHQAQKMLIRIQPLLSRCLFEIREEDEVEVKKAFFNLTYEDFLEELFDCLREGTSATTMEIEKEELVESFHN
jgi:hypothetical protein